MKKLYSHFPAFYILKSPLPYLKEAFFTVCLMLLYLVGFGQDAVGDYRSNATSFNWGAAASWEICTSAGNPGTFGATSTYPGQNSGTGKVTIRDGHTAILNVSPANPIAALAIGGGASGILKFERNTNRTLIVTNGLTLLSGAAFNVNNNSTGNGGNDNLYIGGNVDNAGTITSDTRTKVNLIFNGTASQTVTGSGSTTVYSIIISNTSGVTFKAPITVLSSTSVNINALLILESILTSNSTINGILRINTGGKVSHSPVYTNSSTLYYHTASVATGQEWNGTGTVTGTGVPQNVTIDLAAVSNQISTAGYRTVPGTLKFIKGLLNTGSLALKANTVTGASATSGWLNGTLVKDISAAGTTLFDIGSASYYTPASFNFSNVSTPGTFQVATRTPLTSSSGFAGLILNKTTHFLNRYWKVTKPATSNLTGTFSGTFTYVPGDLVGGTPTGFSSGIYNNSRWIYPGQAIPGVLQFTTPGGIPPETGTGDFAFGEAIHIAVTGVTAANKVYDGTTNAALNFSKATFSGPSVLQINSASAIGNFNDKNIGTGKPVIITGVTLSGYNSGAYVVFPQPTAQANITPRPITITAVTNTKIWDGNTSAAAIPQVSPAGGVQTGDVANFTEVYDDPHIGTGKTLIPSGNVTDGNSGNNYTYTFVNNNTGEITGVPITQADFRTRKDGNFSNSDVWLYNQGEDNWVPAGAVPTSNNNVNIRDKITLDQDFTVGAGKLLELSSLDLIDTFNIAPGKTLSVIGSADFNSKRVTIQSSAAGSGAIGTSIGSITAADNFTVERYISDYRAWRMLSIPTSGTQSFHDAWQEGQPATVNNRPGFGTILTRNAPDALASGFDYKTPGNSLQYFVPATGALTSVPSTANTIATTSGYFVFHYGDRSVNPTSAITPATILRTTGKIYTGDQPAITIPADQDALIGNIYPSAIDVRNLLKTGGSESTSFSFWDPRLAGTQHLGAYQTLTLNEGSGEYEITPGLGGTGVSSGSVYNTIQSGLAFYASAIGTEGSIQFVENAKTAGSTTSLFSVPQMTKRLIANLYTITSSGKELSDGTMQLFDDRYSNEVDGLDAKKRYNFGENFYISKKGKGLVVEKHPLLSENDTIYFAIEGLKSKSYQFEFISTELQASDLLAVLEDSYTGINTPVNLNGTTTIAFSVDGNAASKAINRFRIVFKGSPILAVGITNARAYTRANTNVVEWSVSDQQDVASYQVEKSLTGNNFVSIATIKASGTSFRWEDQSPAQGNNYYRIAIVEKNGIKFFSQVMKVSFSKGAGITISPNTITNSVINMQFGKMPIGNYGIRLININGSVLAVNKLYYDGAAASKSVNIPGNLATGSYTLEIIYPDKTKTVQKVLIAR